MKPNNLFLCGIVLAVVYVVLSSDKRTVFGFLVSFIKKMKLPNWKNLSMGWLISGGIIILGFMSGVVQGNAGGDDTLLICIIWGIAGVIWLYAYKLHSEKRKTSSQETTQHEIMQLIELPQDAHDAVERFAKMVNDIQIGYRTHGMAWNPEDKHLIIQFDYGANGQNAKAYFRLAGVFKGCCDMLGYQLGQGLSELDDYLEFNSNQISGLEQWLGRGNRETQSEWEYKTWVEHIVLCAIKATVEDNCPNAHLVSSQTTVSEHTICAWCSFS